MGADTCIHAHTRFCNQSAVGGCFRTGLSSNVDDEAVWTANSACSRRFLPPSRIIGKKRKEKHRKTRAYVPT